MATPTPYKTATEIPKQVFEEFLHALAVAEAKTPPEVIERLRTTLLEEKSFTERALREAIFGEEAQS